MKVIEPSIEIIDMKDGDEILKKIERIGRTCYKSESRITEDSAAPFVADKIKLGHESVIEHEHITVKITCDRGVTHEIVRHRMANYCVTGDMIIRSMNQNHWTVEELYNYQFDPKKRGRIKLIEARSVDEDSGIIVANHISKITKMGIKPVFQITTQSGRTLKCTGDHKIYTPDGYKELSDLSIGDYVYANGKPLLENPDWLRNYYLVENHTRKETAEAIGCCEAYVYQAFVKYGIRKPWSDRPNRHPGHGVKGMFSKESLEYLSEIHKGEKNPGYKKDRNELSRSGGYAESARKFDRDVCELCGSTENVEIHHIDKNPRNNSDDNVMKLCHKCHVLWHKEGAIGVFKDKIVSITPMGEDTVYDITMDEPYHNFVANGIIVHNCQESTRYCNYSKNKYGNEITVIRPCFFDEDSVAYSIWYDSCEASEKAYFDLLENGCKPEEARDVLPNSLKTELVMTMDLREWRHFLSLRTDKAAHPQIRQIANMILEEFKSRVPVIFDDIEPYKEAQTNE